MDLQRFQIDLKGMFTDPPRESPRRILTFAEHCARWEPNSRLRAAILGPEHYGWGRTERVAADIFDATWAIAYARAGVKDQEPPSYPRPGGKRKPARTARQLSVAQVAQITRRG